MKMGFLKYRSNSLPVDPIDLTKITCSAYTATYAPPPPKKNPTPLQWAVIFIIEEQYNSTFITMHLVFLPQL